MSSIVRFLKGGVLAVALMYSALTVAGGLGVSPLRLSIVEGREQVTSFNVFNRGDSKMRYQVEAFAWSQSVEGEEKRDPSVEVFVFPKIFDVEAGQSRMVRVGYHGTGALGAEKAYRLKVVELESSTQVQMAAEPVVPMKPVEAGIGMRSAFDFPLYVQPRPATPNLKVERLGLLQDKLAFWIVNAGNAHATLWSKFEGVDGAGKSLLFKDLGGRTVLGQASIPFSMDISREQCLQLASIRVHAEFVPEDTTIEGGKPLNEELTLDHSQCPEK